MTRIETELELLTHRSFPQSMSPQIVPTVIYMYIKKLLDNSGRLSDKLAKILRQIGRSVGAGGGEEEVRGGRGRPLLGPTRLFLLARENVFACFS